MEVKIQSNLDESFCSSVHNAVRFSVSWGFWIDDVQLFLDKFRLFCQAVSLV